MLKRNSLLHSLFKVTLTLTVVISPFIYGTNIVSASAIVANLDADTVIDDSPTVTDTDPANNDTNVFPTANLTINFSEDVTLGANWFDITCSASGSHTAAVSGGPQSYILDPDADFAYGENCTVTIQSAEITDSDTNDPPDNMESDYAFSFATISPHALVINEIDYDQPSTDDAEFIELKNIGTEAINLSNYQLDLINGTNAASYKVIALPDTDLTAGDYFVVCANAATVPNCDLDVSPNTNLIQNGSPDAIALEYIGNGLVIIEDTVSYEGDTAALYTESSGVGVEDNADIDSAGISRFPDGADTNQNNVDFSLRCISPGGANRAESSDCLSPTATPTAISTNTPTEIQTDTPTFTPTSTYTAIASLTLSSTPTYTPTHTPTHTPTYTITPSLTPTNTPTEIPTDTPTFTPMASNTPTATHTSTPSLTPTNTPTDTPTQTPTDTPTNTPTNTITPSLIPTHTPTYTFMPTYTITPSLAPTHTFTPTPTDIPTRTPAKTATFTATATLTFSPTSTATDTFTYTPTDTAAPSFTPTFTPTATLTFTPTSTATNTPAPTGCVGNLLQNGSFELPLVPGQNIPHWIEKPREGSIKQGFSFNMDGSNSALIGPYEQLYQSVNVVIGNMYVLNFRASDFDLRRRATVSLEFLNARNRVIASRSAAIEFRFLPFLRQYQLKLVAPHGADRVQVIASNNGYSLLRFDAACLTSTTSMH